MPVDMDDPKMDGYIPLQDFIDQDGDQSSRIRDLPYGKKAEELQISAATLTFGNTGQGSESPAQALVLTNIGYETVNIYGTTLEGAFVLKSAVPGSLLPGEAIVIQVAFAPTVVGAASGSLYFNTGDAAGDELVELVGTGVLGSPLPPDELEEFIAEQIDVAIGDLLDGKQNASANLTTLATSAAAARGYVGLPEADGDDAGYDVVTGVLGVPYVIHEPTFMNPTRRWAIDGSGSAGDQAAWAAALLWAQTNKRTLSLPSGEFVVPAALANLSAEDASQVIIPGFTFYKPDNGVRLEGRGGANTIFKAGAVADNMALVRLDGNSDGYSGSPLVDSRAQGKNYLAGIGFMGRGNTIGNNLRAIDIRANWNTEIIDCDFFGFSGDVINVYSAIAAASGYDDADGTAFMLLKGIRASHCGKFFFKCVNSRIAGFWMEDFNVRNMTGGFMKAALVHSTITKGSWSGSGNVTDQTGGLWLLNAESGAICRNVNIVHCSAEANLCYEIYAQECEGFKIDGFQPTVYQPAATEGGDIPEKAGVILGAGAEHVEIRFGTAPGQSRASGVADYTAPYVRAKAGSRRIKIKNSEFNMTLVPHIVIENGHTGGIEIENCTGAFHVTNNPKSRAIIQYGSGVENVKVDGYVTRQGDRYPAARYHLNNAAVISNHAGDAAWWHLDGGSYSWEQEYDHSDNMVGGVFTAPHSGWYDVEGIVQYTGFGAGSHTYADLVCIIDRTGTPVYRFLAPTEDLTNYTLSGTTLVTMRGSTRVFLDEGQTVEIGGRVGGAGGTKTIEIVRNTANPWLCEFAVRAVF